jgi:hypothetical protein
MSLRIPIALVCAALLVAVPARAQADPTGGTSYTSSPRGGTAAQAQASQGTPAPTASTTTPASTTAPGATTPPPPAVPPATVQPDGTAVAPAGAPEPVTALIAAANQIASTPYRYGGGHKSFTDTAYDCSGSVSYALHGAGLLGWTLDSTGLSHFGTVGRGMWITIYANKTHTYLVVAGLRFDTSGRPKNGSRWQTAIRSNKGFAVRHPAGL